MAINGQSMDRAKVTLVFESGTPRPLGWAYVRLDDAGEERAYVMVPPSSSLGTWGDGAGLAGGMEFQPKVPFPLEAARGTGSGDATLGGPVGVHFYGTGSV